jgi:hypothetical protein
MREIIHKYGKIALALVAIFLSGQAIGWMLATHRSEGRSTPPSADSDQWTREMLARLRSDLELTDAQVKAIEPRLRETSQQIQQERDRAMFQIHLHLVKLHDDLAPSVTPEQKIKLDRSRQNLIELMKRKFPHFLRDS